MFATLPEPVINAMQDQPASFRILLSAHVALAVVGLRLRLYLTSGVDDLSPDLGHRYSILHQTPHTPDAQAASLFSSKVTPSCRLAS